MEKKLREGDVINIQAETVAEAFEASGDITLVEIESSKETEDLTDFSKLAKLHIYKIVKVDVHKDLAKHGVNIGQFTLDGIKAKSFVINDDETKVRINGEHDIPLKSRKRGPLTETLFLNDAEAGEICTRLNKVQLKKMKQLHEASEKALITLGQVVEKNYF